MATPPAVELPPGPRAPAVWQTIAWMTRPGAFMRGVHTRYGDPVTIRTYWTEEPMVLFSSPDAVRAVFRLDPSIAPAGQSWEFLRPFAGSHSILLLDGEEHLRERRLMAGPFHGERMRASAPIVCDLARAELATWQGRVLALERMRELALQIILRVVFGARDDELAALRRAIDDTLSTVRSLPWLLAMAVVRKDLGPLWEWLPEGALYHDPNAYLAAERERLRRAGEALAPRAVEAGVPLPQRGPWLAPALEVVGG